MNTQPKQPKIYTHNGIEYGFKPDLKKWEFKGIRPNGQSFFFISGMGRGANPAQRAKKIAGIVSGSLKRAFADAQDCLDSMSRGQISKLIN